MKQPKIRFVDLHYKGVKIEKGWKHLVRNSFLFVWLAAMALFVFLFMGCSGRNYSLVHDFSKLAVEILLPSVLLSGALAAAFLFGVYPLWNYLADLQRLCRVIYTYPLYQVRNYINESALQDKGKVIREIEYFPRFYYMVKRGKVLVTVALDGSQFHQDGSFETLTKVLEETFTLNMSGMSRRREYLTYHLFRGAEINRLHMERIRIDGYVIPLMEDVAWKVNEIPHALVVGSTGGGKSYFLHFLIAAFLQMGAELYICDPKNSALVDYERILPHVVTAVEDIQSCLTDCVAAMEERYALMRKHSDYKPGQDFSAYDLSPVVLVLDEYSAYVAVLDKAGKEEFKANLSQIVLKGREAGVFAVLATQRPDASSLDGSIRDQLGLRVALGEMSEEGYRMIFGGTERPKGHGGVGKGYLYMSGFSYVQKFYAPLIPKGYEFVGKAKEMLKNRK